VDKDCQSVIEQCMIELCPGHVMLGEENVAAGSAAADEAVQNYISEEWLW
jgi:hypothetical protein